MDDEANMKRATPRCLMAQVMESSGVHFGTSGARGLVAQMTDEVCIAYTLAFLRVISLPPGCRVALGIDLRPSSPAIAAACIAAIHHAGLEVDYCGALPTPALAFYAQEQGIPAIMITGSHIPFERNGIKFYRASGEITKADEADIAMATAEFPAGLVLSDLPEPKLAARQGYIDRYLRFFPAKCLDGMRLGFYQHSSVARDMLGEILQSLGAEVIVLGRTNEFVPIDTEAVREQDILMARQWAADDRFDGLFSTDGDADRPMIGDERGTWLRGDIVGTLCAQYLQASSVVTPVNSTTTLEKCAAFASVLRTRIGSPYVIEGMAQRLSDGERNVVGFEANGGFLVGSRIEKNGRVLAPLMTRDALLPILCLFSMARENECRVSDLPLSLPARFTASDRLQSIPTETIRTMLQDLVASPAAVDELLRGLCGRPTGLDQTDGLRIFLEHDEIVHFRASGNAPELRCYAESASQERSGFLVQACLRRMKDRLVGMGVREQH
jgi:phosphomannomutase